MKKHNVLFSAVIGLLFASSAIAKLPTSTEILLESGHHATTSSQALNGQGNGMYMVAPGGSSSASAAAIPEPGSLLLLGIGLAGIGLARRRRS